MRFNSTHRLLAILILIGAIAMFGSGLTASASPDPNRSTSANQMRSLTGTVSVIYGDGEPGVNPISLFEAWLTDAQGNATQLLMSEVEARALRGREVTVQGVPAPGRLPNRPAIRVTSATPLQSTNGLGDAIVSGSQPWVNILCRFADSTGTTPEPPSYFEGMMSNTRPGMDHYWRQVSYNNINIVGSATFGWYNLPQPRSYYVVNNSLDHSRAANDCTAVADADVYFPTYVGINLMFNQNLDCCAWGGSRGMNLDGMYKSYRMTWEPPWGYANVSVIAHEMGHGFGFPHSSSPYSSGPYDSGWDVMSNAWKGCSPGDATYGCLPQGTISYHLNLDGWIPANRKVTVNQNSQATVTLERLNQPPSPTNPLMAIIPIPGTSRFYTVEARFRMTGDYEAIIPGDAVIIHEVNPSRDADANVVDPDNNGNVDDEGAMWKPGETFTDATNNISVQVLSSTSSNFTVTIRSGTVAARPDTIGIMRSNQFLLRNTNSTGPADISVTLGASTDLPVAGDWDGDGVDTVGVYRPSTSAFYLKNANTTAAPLAYQFTLGSPNDLPMVGDWNNDGSDGVGVFRPTNGLIYLRNTLTTGFADFTMVLGISGDRPVAGDWNGNGVDSPGVYRPSQSRFYLTNQVCNCTVTADYQLNLGAVGDVGFAGDWDANGSDSVGVFRPTNGVTYLRNALTTGYADIAFTYGTAGDKPLAGKWTSTSAPQAPVFSVERK